MPDAAVVRAASLVLAHTPGLARHGSKPMRTLPAAPELATRFLANLRSFDDAVRYPPHQAFLGACHPRELPPRPWVGAELAGGARFAPFGELMPEEEFLGLMAVLDEFDLLVLTPEAAELAAKRLAEHPLATHLDLDRIPAATGDVTAVVASGALPVHLAPDRLAGALRGAHAEDESLAAHVLLENLACKATGTLALLHLLHDHGLDPAAIDYTISCSEEAVGDRYQRGGGNMGKTIAAVAGLAESSGADVKNFCAAPIPALVIAASLVVAGVFDQVVVVAGGSQPKLGMKFEGHLHHGLPVLEDVIGGVAVLVTADDGVSPRIRLDAVGRHRVSSGGSGAQILHDLAVRPLEAIGAQLLGVDDYATELHNPEITEPQGSGDVAARNYRTIAALAARRKEIVREEIDLFVAERGMPGYAPTQGHLASAVCYLPHALTRLTAGPVNRVLLLAKGSLFLGRMSQRSDGMSILLERNGG
ncbi:MAG TPA: glycine/sarcosine/betaine reductase complex component C subunit beta [Pseudonocardiaceae bacterium]|nr:glycine/sarcosine/betaine reductase complex component C subunit beta [Pseudonocardiaceae bacterium]